MKRLAQQQSSFKRLRLVVVGFCLACLTIPLACAQEKNEELKKATDLLKSMMEKYGEAKDEAYFYKISNVKFDGCSQTLDEIFTAERGHSTGHPSHQAMGFSSLAFGTSG